MSRVALLPNSRSDPDHIFYTASIINNNTSTAGTGQDPIARFVETRDVPILRDANEYDVTVLKVSVNGGGKTLPILIPQIQPTMTYPTYTGGTNTSIVAGPLVGTAPNWTQSFTMEVSTPQTVNFPSGYTINNSGSTGIFLRNRQVPRPTVSVTGSGASRRQQLVSTLLPSRTNNIKSVVVVQAGLNRTVTMVVDVANRHAYQNGSRIYMTGWSPSSTSPANTTASLLNGTTYVLTGSTILGNGDNELVFSDLSATLPTPAETPFLPANGGTTFPDVTLISTGVDPNNTTSVVASALTVTGSDPNMTIYSVSLQASVYTGAGDAGMFNFSSDEVYVQWIPELFDRGTLVPASSNPSQAESDYYYLYSYNHWVVLLNMALLQAYTQLQQNITSVTTTSAYVLQNRCPTFEYDEVTKLFSLYTDAENTDWGLTQGPPNYATLGPAPGSGVLPTTVGGVEFMYLGYNLNFEGLMTNFDTQFFGQDQVVWGNGWNNAIGSAGRASSVLYQPENTIIVRNKTGTNIQNMINPATGLPYSPAQLNYVSTQDFCSTGSLWSPIGAIVLTTQLLPIRSEFTSAPVVLGSSSSTGGTSAFQTVLIDFNEDHETADGFRGLMKFNPSAEFVRVNMTQSHQEIKTLDFQVNWRNRLTNQLIPLRIYNTASITVRLLFRRRG
jgi:hypothetical protein